MNGPLSPDAKAILLLTAPLIAGRAQPTDDLLTPTEYKKVARRLFDRGLRPADLLTSASEPVEACRRLFEGGRLERLLGRGFLLSQAVERWQARAIWVKSRADDDYPARLKARLKDDAPPVLYGCGAPVLLDQGGLAVVGSRNVEDDLIRYTENIGRLAAEAGRTLVSGGARGIDQAAMRGAIEAGGRVAGGLADSLERTALNRDHRNLLMEGRLVLISPYDPLSGFNVGHAMQRNKLIYALADAALVVNSDYKKGGTWSGAVEQLEKLRFVTVYVRTTGPTGQGIEALQRKGALPWPDPADPEAFNEALAVEPMKQGSPLEIELPFEEPPTPEPTEPTIAPVSLPESPAPTPLPTDQPITPAEDLFAKVRELLEKMTATKTETEIAADLQVNKAQARDWLQRLVEEGVLEKLSKPARYRAVSSIGRLFDGGREGPE
jgi:predicted Rossmann fold nucleotide-binding protein DprA/Smf involved in DNA uptake